MENTRNNEIHDKGFDMYSYSAEPAEFKRVKAGTKTLDDATLDLGAYAKLKALSNRAQICKGDVLRALVDKDYDKLRIISNLFYDINGVYQRACDYVAFLYRYDWYVASQVIDESVKPEKVLRDYAKILNYFDNSYIKKLCGDIALKVVKNGCYYGYLVPSNKNIILQELPVKYCRTKYVMNNMPIVEFDMRFFDTFKDISTRLKMLKLFPDEFSKGYTLYRQNKLVSDDVAGNRITGSWYLLEPGSCIKFNINNSDVPMFVSSIPAIMDLDDAQALDRKKQMQKLLKIIVQKLPLDQHGDLIFDIDEARDIHNNAVQMLQRAVGVDVLTTFTDVDSIDMSDRNTATSTDDLSKVERSVFNSLGISQNLFNTEGNMALEKSILNDESALRDLILQFNIFFNAVLAKLGPSSKKYSFKFYMLETTQHNYQALAKLYKEGVQMGYSKMLPQVALGQSQSFILNSAYFENEILNLSEIMIPPLMSSTMSSEDILALKDSSSKRKNQDNKEAGRPEKENDQKSDKTIQNLESMN